MNPPKGNYILCQWADEKIIHTAGHLPQPADGELITGKVGRDLDKEEAYKAARYGEDIALIGDVVLLLSLCIDMSD